jgi:uncharacterized lipoprotein NlpE involved in copper resistance
MKNILLILAAAIMLTACGGNSRQKTTAGVPDMHNAENALDYQGTYKGVFPAADCPGIEIELTLHNDNTYTMIPAIWIVLKSRFNRQETIR